MKSIKKKNTRLGSKACKECNAFQQVRGVDGLTGYYYCVLAGVVLKAETRFPDMAFVMYPIIPADAKCQSEEEELVN